jgi:hypothetical protein
MFIQELENYDPAGGLQKSTLHDGGGFIYLFIYFE